MILLKALTNSTVFRFDSLQEWHQAQPQALVEVPIVVAAEHLINILENISKIKQCNPSAVEGLRSCRS